MTDDTRILTLEALVQRLRRFIDHDDVLIPERDIMAPVWVELAAIDNEIAAAGLEDASLEKP